MTVQIFAMATKGGKPAAPAKKAAPAKTVKKAGTAPTARKTVRDRAGMWCGIKEHFRRDKRAF